MSAKQNITVAIDATLLRKARAIAAGRGLSVSALLAAELKRLVADESSHVAAHRRALALFAAPLALGGAPIDRASLHDRSRLR